ncbi:non-ribosomal peptide synthetase [Paenibacillus tarimensis]
MSRVHKELGAELPLREVFARPLLHMQAEYIDQAAGQGEAYTRIPQAPKQPFYPASAVQKRLFALSQMDGAGMSYNITMTYSLTGTLDEARLQRAWQQVVERHEALRTSFAYVDGELMQRIDPQAAAVIEQLPRTAVKAGEEESSDVRRRVEEFFKPFDLKKGPLIRAGLLPLAGDRHLFLIDIHHTIADGMSVPLLMQELCALYKGQELQPVPLHYKDYTCWQLQEPYQQAQREHESYWLNELSGEIPVLDLVTDHPRPSVRSFEGGHVRFRINAELTARLRSMADASGTTLYTVLLAAFSVLLSKYSDQEDILIGSPVAGRTHADLEQVVGMFVNTVVVRSRPRQDLTFGGLLDQLKERVVRAFEHQDYPFEQLVDKLGLQRDASRNPLFDVLFILQNVDRSSLLMDQVSIEPYDYLHRTAKFDLTLFAAEELDGISAGFEYSVQLFQQVTVERMAAHYMQLLSSLAECGGQIRLSELSLLSREERAKVTEEYAVNRWAVTGPATIHQRFEEQVMKRPQHPAVLYNDDTITYAELNARANQLARSIRASHPGLHVPHERRRGQEDGLLVGIMAKHPVDRIAAVLATLKAGLAYVPIDPSYPRERIAHMAEDSGMQLVLTDLEEASQLLPGSIKVLPLSQEPVAAPGQGVLANQENLGLDVQADDLAYIIYTSGSTGLPKGVAIAHRGVVNYAAWRTQAYGIGADDRTLQMISFSFDGYGASLYSALLTGGSLVVVRDEDSKDYKVIRELASRHGVTSFSAIPSMYQALLDFAETSGGLDQLKTVILAAERPAEELVARSRRMLPKTLLINEYGPTENTIATAAQIGIEPGRTAVIGRPVGNHQIYIVDRAGQPVPIGVPGELCAAGPGLARGYWKKPKLTAEKFTAHPETGRRMYRTGDMARWLEDGTIEFLGRLDEQVKIRGFRVELEEIAARLRLHLSVTEAVVLDRKDEHGQPYLCAYIIPEDAAGRADGGSPAPSYTVTARQAAAYRTFLEEALPDYMVPAYFVHLERLPLSPNGKLDKKALPAPDVSSGASEIYEAPRTEMECRLAEIWQQVLGTERVGIHDHFFNLGGDSIKAIQVSSRLHQQGLVLEMKHLFQHPVLMQLAPHIKEDEETISQDEVTGDVPLTAIQHWFFSQAFEEQHHFNQAVMLQRSSGFDTDALKQALTAIVVHHDALRMVFRQVSGTWTARNLSAHEIGPVTLNIVETGSMTEGEREAYISRQVESAQRSLDIEKGPLYRFTLLRTAGGDHLHIVIHHLVVDGVSWRILLEDLAEAYVQAERGEAVRLPAKTLSVREWAHKVRQYAVHSELLKEIPYWQAVEQDNPGPLPARRIAGQRRPEEQAEAVMECTREQTEQLLKQVHRTYSTEINDVLLTALALALRQWSGRQKTLIHLEGHGREKLDRPYNISRTIGWFTAQYPVVLDASRPDDMGYMLKSVKDSLRRIPNHGIGYGVLEYLTPQEQRQELRFGLQPEISFNYLGQSDQAQDNGVFSLSKLGSGTNISPSARKLYAMEWTGMVADGRLRMTVGYSRGEYEEAAIAELTGLYKEQLQAIISHCMGKTGTEVSPSDLVYNKLSIDKLSQISQLLNKKLK